METFLIFIAGITGFMCGFLMAYYILSPCEMPVEPKLKLAKARKKN
jgi:hypothetical protein